MSLPSTGSGNICAEKARSIAFPCVQLVTFLMLICISSWVQISSEGVYIAVGRIIKILGVSGKQKKQNLSLHWSQTHLVVFDNVIKT